MRRLNPNLLLVAGILLGALAPSAVAAQPIGSLAGWVSADLDGDHQPDTARPGAFHNEGRGFIQEIHLGFSQLPAGILAVRTTAVGARLVARDVDGDSDRDLILETFFREPLAVLLNDGEGGFHEADLADFRALLRQEPRSLEESERPGSLVSAGNAAQNQAAVPHLTAAFLQRTDRTPTPANPSPGACASPHSPYTRGPPAR